MVEAGEAGQLEVAGAQVRVELKDHLQQSRASARYQDHGHSVRMTCTQLYTHKTHLIHGICAMNNQIIALNTLFLTIEKILRSYNII